MAEDLLVQAVETFSLIGVLVAFVIFARLAVKARAIGKFRFQLSIFMLVWVLAEVPHTVSTLGLISTAGYEDIGLTFHMLSMAAFAVFIGAKSFSFARIHSPLPSTTEIAPFPPKPTGGLGNE